jgi:mannose-6-phosphate isomerase-like protein (cupin superfamily)
MSVSFWLMFFACSGTLADEPALVVAADDAQLEWGPCPDFIPAGCEIAVLHGDPAIPNVDILFKVPGDFTIPAHRHTSAERMILLSGELHVTYEGQETAIVEVGSYAYGPAERTHEAYCVQGDACVLFIAFEAPLDAYPIGQQAK